MSAKHKMIFFGAGASSGSDDVHCTPPVGKDLFDALKFYDKNVWGLIPEEFAQNFKPNFENGMIMYTEKDPESLVDLQRSMARYFYRFIPTTKSLYFELVKKILDAKWSGCLASINYERLLSLSCSMVVQSEKKKLTFPQIELLLPHGRCDIFVDKKNVKGLTSGVSMRGLNVGTDGPIVIAKNDSDFYYRIDNIFPPVMCYYEPLKRVTSGREFIKNQRKKFEEEVLKADIVCIIGVKVNCSDYHIWGPLTKTKGRLLYCSGEEAGEEFEEWKRCYRNNRNDKIIQKNFKEGFREICQTLEI